jgi:hypothetical protein
MLEVGSVCTEEVEWNAAKPASGFFSEVISVMASE